MVGTAAPERVADSSQHATGTHGTPTAAAPSRRRTTITTPTGQWALGKTIGAGSMGKVKLAKNMETGEQVNTSPIVTAWSHVIHSTSTDPGRRSLSRSSQGSRLRSIAAPEKQKGQTAQKKYVRLVKPLLSA